ncbi:hypothetical protein [Brazilian marseillevirus]|uniref:hypothetical protein n=1 Tax=Brazilian marseillevirus TaxID=1813599 RepID=UPI00078586BB|nr:hypothetical protein A3303_gp367 [Brazilian marseillevirus]AMQ10875.1 hypothetical protein [Brazilian marseillevirus]
MDSYERNVHHRKESVQILIHDIQSRDRANIDFWIRQKFLVYDKHGNLVQKYENIFKVWQRHTSFPERWEVVLRPIKGFDVQKDSCVVHKPCTKSFRDHNLFLVGRERNAFFFPFRGFVFFFENPHHSDYDEWHCD